MDAVVFYNQLRRAGVGLHTCCEGAIDLEDFAKQLLLFINQKASNDFLVELSAKALRGKIAAAQRGAFNGGRPRYGLERGLFDDAGNLVRKVLLGECVKIKGHHVRAIPTDDPLKLQAVEYAFRRFDGADIGLRQLARELEQRGYPGPTGAGWSHQAVGELLSTVEFVGMVRWGMRAAGKYHQAQGGDIVPVKNGQHVHYKPQEEAIAVKGAHEGVISIDLFDRVQRKLQRTERRKNAPKADYPLSGLIVCKHCGLPMEGYVSDGLRRYICKRYARYGRDGSRNTTCGRHTIDAARVLAWLVWKLQGVLQEPGKAALVHEIKKQLKTQAKATSGDVERLQKRAAELDREVGRLVKAIRTLDAVELVEELAIVRGERDRVKAELAQAGRLTDPMDLDAEAEQIADQLWATGQQLTTKDPAVLREVLRRFVSRITCRWEALPGRRRGAYRLVGGDVELKPQAAFDVMGVVDESPRQFYSGCCRTSNSAAP
jgi:hypothetical protein